MGTYVRKSRQDRIHEIQLAALEIFLSKGYTKTTTEDIIRATTLTKGGFYNYYRSKDEILADLVRIKNFNYLQKEASVEGCTTPEEVSAALARAFLARMTDSTPQSRLHLLMAQEWANGNPHFAEIYDNVEKETLSLIIGTIRKVFPEFDETLAHGHLMLLYRINNTMHYIKKIQYRDALQDEWKVEAALLYELYCYMFNVVIREGIGESLPKSGLA